MEGKTLARIAAAVFAGVAITATAIEMTREEETSADPTAAVIAPAAPGPAARGAAPMPTSRRGRYARRGMPSCLGRKPRPLPWSR